MPETNRRGWVIQPAKKAPQKQSIKKANFLFFLSFVCFALLTIATTGWAELTGLTVDAGGDDSFRGGTDRVRIIFTVDEDSDGDPYVVQVVTIGSGENPRINILGVIAEGVVSANETVELFWDGTVNNRQLADGDYTIRVIVDDDTANDQRATVTLDSSAPRVSDVLASDGVDDIPITDGSFLKGPLRLIKVTGIDDGAPIDLSNRRNTIFLRNARQAVSRGTLNYDDANETLIFTLVDPLDEPNENGKYTLILILLDEAGNVVQNIREFTFDNVAPRIARVSTNRRTIVPGGSVNQRISFVEATLTDNLPDGINPLASEIKLTGPGGPDDVIPGNQTVDSDSGRIRLELLSPLLGMDSSDDGRYTVTVEAVDKAGNPTSQSVSFVYDNRAPSLISLSPIPSDEESFDFTNYTFGDTVYYNLPINGFVATFNDDSGVGVHLTGGRQSTQLVFGTPKKSGEGINALKGRVVTDSEENTLTYILDEPIVRRDGSQDGRYTLNIQATDIAGNTKTYDYQLIYDTQVPTLVSTVPASNETVSELSQVQVKLNEKTSGINFIESEFRLWKGTVEDVLKDALEQHATLSVQVPVNVTSNGTDTFTLTLMKPFALDGSDDGPYTIEVIPVDQAGNKPRDRAANKPNDNLVDFNTLPVIRGFYFVSQGHEPKIRLTMPEATRVNRLPTIPVELVDYIGVGINVDASTVTLKNPQGTLVPQVDSERTVEEVYNPDSSIWTLTWTPAARVARDGSADGEYIVTATFVDFTGRRFTQEFPIVLDTQIPALVSTVPAANEIVSELSQVEVKLSELTSGIDFLQSTFQLTHGDAEVPVNITSNGTDTVMLTLAEPIALDGSDDGTYAIKVAPTDRAGNTGIPVVREFYLVSQGHEPEIRLVMPETTTLNSLPTVVVELVDYVGAGIDFDASTVTVRSPQGVLVPEKDLEPDEASNLLTWNTEVSVPRDGSEDGEYTITATFVDFIGRRFTQEFSFVLDTLFPTVETVQVATGSQTPLIEDRTVYSAESIIEVTVVFDETSNDVDFEGTLISLVGSSEASIPVTTVNDGQTVLTISSDALTQDGEYELSITPRDRAGNQGGVIYRKFVYDTEEPRITVPTPLIFNQQPVTYIGNALRQFQFSFTIEDVGPAGLYLEEQTLEVMNAAGVNIPVAVTRDELTNQIFLALPASFPRDGSVDGEYTAKISLVDKAGNRSDAEYTIIYDSTPPQIASVVIDADPQVGLVPNRIAKIVEPINRITLQFEEATRINFANTQITLTGPGASDTPDDAAPSSIPLTLEDDGVSQVSLSFLDVEQVGTYTLSVTPQDAAGNAAAGAVEYKFILDMPLPSVGSVVVNTDPPMELVPNRIAEILEPVNSITLQFEEATQINFANTQITLMGPDPSGATDPDSGLPIEFEFPLTLENDGVSEVTVSFLDLEQIGSYVLSVTPQDVAGNVAAGAVAYRFILDIPLPQVSSVVIGETVAETSSDVVYVNANNIRIGAFLLDPTETGLSLGSEGSTITVVDAAETVVPGAMGSNGEDLIVWQPITLTSDGTTDGRYSVYVTPVDKAGRQGSAVYREFIYDTQEPEIIAAAPMEMNLSQPVSYMSESLTQFNFTVADVGPADLELSDQMVSLRDAEGSLVPAQLTNDTENQLFLTLDQPLPLDGSMDGEYTVLVELADKAGNFYTIEHLIVYDTQAPTLVSTVPSDGALLTEDVTQIQVKLNDEGGSGIDWTETTVTLINPNGTEISGELVSDGETELTLTTRQLIEDGRYVIRVQAVDRAGNGGATDFRQNFILSRRLPTIVSTEPTTAPADEAFMNEALERIEVTLEAGDTHDIGRHLSTLRLLNPTTQVVAGQLERTNDQLIYNLVRPLATDGSEDGVYTIEFTPISASGRAGQLQRLIFTYDTQAPEIESDEVINLVVAQPEVNNSLTEIHVNLTDETSGIDWDNLDEKWLTFERLSPNPTKISGRISDDGQSNLTFRLTVPLADNGSADGEYRITLTPKDRAGNDDKPYEKVFIYDTSPPMIDPGTLLINEAPLLVDINAENYPTAVSTTGGVVIQANIFDTGLGVNLAQSKIVVRSPDGSEISGSTQQNGVDTLIFKSDGLTVQGVYKVTVISIGNDSELLGFAPTDSLTTEFLYETTVPTATLTSDGGETELTDKALPLEGTATDPSGTQRIGQDEMTVPASGVWLVEIVGIGPDKQPIDPVPVVDDSDAEQEPWSVWSIDFLPTRSGEYDLDVRVTDNAGNYEVYDIGEYTMSVSLTFRGTTFGWPNPLRLSKRDVAFFSFDVNVPRGDTIELTLSIYDWSGDMILSQTYPDVVSGQRNDQLVKWNLENQAGTSVARGLYIFRLEAVNSAGNRANVVGKVLVVE